MPTEPERPPAPEFDEQHTAEYFRRHLSTPPGRYMALYGHQIMLMGPFRFSYRDPELNAWIAEARYWLRAKDQWPELRRKWLTPDELKSVLNEEEEMRDPDYVY